MFRRYAAIAPMGHLYEPLDREWGEMVLGVDRIIRPRVYGQHYPEGTIEIDRLLDVTILYTFRTPQIDCF